MLNCARLHPFTVPDHPIRYLDTIPRVLSFAKASKQVHSTFSTLLVYKDIFYTAVFFLEKRQNTISHPMYTVNSIKIVAMDLRIHSGRVLLEAETE